MWNKIQNFYRSEKMITTKAHRSEEVTERELRHQALSLEVAKEGIVLLENKGVLPMEPCRVALYGAGAGYTITGGSGSGEVNTRHNVTVEEGLEKAGFEIATKSWIARYDRLWRAGKALFLHRVRWKLIWPTMRVINEIMEAEYRYPAGGRIRAKGFWRKANGIDTCIYVLARQSGEGHDLQDQPGGFQMSAREVQHIRVCAEHYERFVLVINTGAPIDLSPLDEIEGIDAIVYMGQLGMEGGTALAQVLTGQCNPSGKLAVTWPKRYADVPFGDEFGKEYRKAYYKEGIYVGYRYYDSFQVSPRYPFGFGRSYTTFAVEHLGTDLQGDAVRCRVKVSNTGSRPGKEVVQVYVRCPGKDREYKRLTAFGKTEELAPGASQELTMTFAVSELSRYDEQTAQTVVDAGRYLIKTGTCSRATEAAAVLRVDEKVVLSEHRHLCAPRTKITQMSHVNRVVIPKGLPELVWAPKDKKFRTFDYTERPDTYCAPARKTVESLTTEECVRLCVGTGMLGEQEGFRTPGAVGHTTTEFLDRDIPNAEFCDGPAGVRLERRAVQYPDGKIYAVDLPLSIYEYFPPFLIRWFVLGNPKKGQMLYQYVTGFPIEAMQAQTWNTALIKRVGKAVHDEMEAYGVTFWLAPAMNIVRNPLCGRNYEYYSEDPLLTGLMAAAVTRGVQCTPDRHVTVKHFCANNQEKERFFMSSEVDERALREIYWKGFETVVKAAHPRAAMAAYNKLNGVYCSENSELCTDLLRYEWGFEGVVMTDWMGTGKDKADEVEAIRAGVDLIMPGADSEVDSLRKAYRDGRLTEAEIRMAAERIVFAIKAKG